MTILGRGRERAGANVRLDENKRPRPLSALATMRRDGQR
jgi:hypothetical protein